MSHYVGLGVMGIPLKSPVEGQDVDIDDKFIFKVNYRSRAVLLIRIHTDCPILYLQRAWILLGRKPMNAKVRSGCVKYYEEEQSRGRE